MKNTIDFLKEAGARLKQETPKFWKQLRIFWTWLTIMASIIIALNLEEIDLLSQVLPRAIANRMADISKIAALVGLISRYQTYFAVKTPMETKDPEISTK